MWRKKTKQAGNFTGTPDRSVPDPHSARREAPDQTYLNLPAHPAGGTDICYCGMVELVYGGNVQVELRQPGHSVMHRKDYPCEFMMVRADADGTHHYERWKL